MRAAAVFAWTGAAAATLAVFSALGGPGLIMALMCLLPGWLLWRYGTRLGAALDVQRIKGQLGDAATLAKTRVGEVVDGIQTTRRQFVRGGFRVLRLVRGLRADMESFGIDAAGIAEISSPAGLLVAAASLAAGIALWALAAIGLLARVIF